MNRIKRMLWTILTRIGLVLFGLTLSIGILELGFRALYPDPSPKLVNQALQLHDTYGIAFTPNAAGWNTSLRGEYSTYVTINSKGLRAPEYDYAKAADAYRILVLGDSFTAALQVADNALFTSLLEEQLNAQLNTTDAAQIVEVINAGVVGYGTTNALAYFVHEGYKYQPDLVLLMFFTGNDIVDNITPPHYQLENDQLVPIDFVYNPNIGTPPWAQEGTAFRQIRNTLYTHSRLYSVAIELLTYALVQRSPELSSLVQAMGFAEAARPVLNAGNIYSFLQPPEEAWTMTEALLVELNQQINARGGQLITAIIPDEAEVDEEKWAQLAAEYPALFSQASVHSKPTARLGQLLEQHEIPYVQLQPALQAHQQKTGEPIHYRYDGHWQPSGHRLAAQVIYDYVVNNHR